ncbi:hypothetical protein Bca52824_091746 [Brassica carinata]|uniref:N-acyl-aliphatic-L-amino acid amidohydrolase n=1 Tax=Brassica carinata TaxID=52824 RepID=A0A8X7NU06_BRACI|nr:hypothetical protein Bca52824_091746 [Brassica carinata]
MASGGWRRILSFAMMSLLILALCILSAAADDGEAIVSRFQEYLRIDTVQPKPDYYKAVDFINSQAKSLSLESQTNEFVKGKPHLLLKWVGSDPTLPAILLNSHTDVVPFEESKWTHHPLHAHMDNQGDIYARGSQDMKCVGMQYIEAIRKLQASGFHPIRSVYLSFVPDEEIGGHDGAEKFAESHLFKSLNVGIVLDEGLPSPSKSYRVFYGERSPWWLVIKAKGPPGHGAKLYDNSAIENLLKSIESIRRFRASQFDLLKAGGIAEGHVVSVNMAFLKAGTPSPTLRQFKRKHSGNPPAVAARLSLPLNLVDSRAEDIINEMQVQSSERIPVVQRLGAPRVESKRSKSIPCISAQSGRKEKNHQSTSSEAQPITGFKPSQTHHCLFHS